jgi:hypothetical protein
MPANHRISAFVPFSTFQEIYPGCCTVAALRPQPLMIERGNKPNHRYTTIGTRYSQGIRSLPGPLSLRARIPLKRAPVKADVSDPFDGGLRSGSGFVRGAPRWWEAEFSGKSSSSRPWLCRPPLRSSSNDQGGPEGGSTAVSKLECVSSRFKAKGIRLRDSRTGRAAASR